MPKDRRPEPERTRRTPPASEGWSVDVNLSARDVAPPWLVVGAEQRVDDNISIRATVESGVFFVADRITNDDARVGVAALVGPRFAFVDFLRAVHP